jgi:hypothetical protein
MDLKARLIELSTATRAQREVGHVTKWSDDIRKEVIFLSKHFNFKTIEEATGLYPSLIRIWKKEFEAPDGVNKFAREVCKEERTMSVTRIIPQKLESFHTREVVACIVKEKLELKIYCSDTNPV